ncbi:MAG: hypothetical protein VB067_11560, partial [Christensenellaceae bacterium]|nr:hypothetical protein [Christensenellaceae bacterium]
MSIAKPAARRRVTGRVLTPWLYVLPLVLLMGTFVYIPMLQNFYYLFRKFSAFSPEQTFVGTENLKTLLTDPVIYSAIRNNIW